MPLPQLATTGRFPWTILLASAVPTALSKAVFIPEGGRKVEYSCPSLVLCFLQEEIKHQRV